MGWPKKWAFHHGMGWGLIALLVFSLLYLVKLAHSVELQTLLSERQPLTAAEFETSTPGEIVWISVTIDEDNETEYEDIVMGCVNEWEDSEDGSWVLDHYLPAEGESFGAHLGEKAIRVFSPGNCPLGEFKDEETGPGGRTEYLGYTRGQQISLLVEIMRSDEWIGGDGVTIIDGGSYGGSPEQQEKRLRFEGIMFSICSIVSLLGLFTLLWIVVQGRRFRAAWSGFAERTSLELRPGAFGGLGRVQGTYKGRAVLLARRRGMGDGGAIPADVSLQVELNPCMSAYELRSHVVVERWLPVLGGEQEIGDVDLDALFVLKGVDRSRWEALLSDSEVRASFMEMRAREVHVVLSEGSLELYWQGLDTDVMGFMMDQGIRLADCLERVEGRGWSDAARALQVEFEQDSGSAWKIESSASGPPWVLRYWREGTAWQTELVLSLLQAVPEDWRMVARTGETEAQRTGDPIVDSQLEIQGFEDGLPAQIIGHTNTTEILLAALCGHPLRLVDRTLQLRVMGLLAEPLELIQDALRLAELLEDFAGRLSPGSGAPPRRD